ncbi:MAG: hypothetical protein ACYST3_04065 [Planctomycetota bacterium]
MKHNRNFSVYTLVILSAFPVLSVSCSNKITADKSDSVFGKKFAGMYLLMETDTEGFHFAYELRSEENDSEYKKCREIPILMITAISQKKRYEILSGKG